MSDEPLPVAKAYSEFQTALEVFVKEHRSYHRLFGPVAGEWPCVMCRSAAEAEKILAARNAR